MLLHSRPASILQGTVKLPARHVSSHTFMWNILMPFCVHTYTYRPWLHGFGNTHVLSHTSSLVVLHVCVPSSHSSMSERNKRQSGIYRLSACSSFCRPCDVHSHVYVHDMRKCGTTNIHACTRAYPCGHTNAVIYT
jgi:hypothetical protein